MLKIKHATFRSQRKFRRNSTVADAFRLGCYVFEVYFWKCCQLWLSIALAAVFWFWMSWRASVWRDAVDAGAWCSCGLRHFRGYCIIFCFVFVYLIRTWSGRIDLRYYFGRREPLRRRRRRSQRDKIRPPWSDDFSRLRTIAFYYYFLTSSKWINTSVLFYFHVISSNKLSEEAWN